EPRLMVILVAALGLVLGSFVSALTYRVPRGRSVASGRSACTSCGHTLGATDLVPLLSWLARRGSCVYCGAAISWRYPAIESTMLGLFIAAALTAPDPVRLALLLAMTTIMVALATFDLEHRKLPDSTLLGLAVLALAWRWHGDRAIV